MERNQESYMAEIKEIEVVERSFEMGKEDIFSENKDKDGSGVLGNFSSLVEEELGKVCLEGVLDYTVDFDANGAVVIDGNGGRVFGKSETDNVCEIVGEDENVSIDGTEVKCGKMENVNGEVEKKYEIVGTEGNGSNEVSDANEKCGISNSMLVIDSKGTKCGGEVSDEEKSDSESESETSCSSSSLSSSSSSSEDDEEEEEKEEEEEEDDDDDEQEEKEKEKEKEKEEEIDMKAEIKALFVEEMFAWSDEEGEEFDSTKAGPIMSKNEIKVLPPIPPVAATLQPCHETFPVGVVLSIVGAQVIVEGVDKHDPLNEGSILWITEQRSPLGIVDEIFGPVKNPYYMVRYNSDNEVPAGIQQGTLISFVPEFVNHVLNNGNLYKKGYDASGENDEELTDEAEFSDDEKEAEYRRIQKMSKRRPEDQTVENMKIKNKSNRRGGQWGGDQHSSGRQPNERQGGQGGGDQHSSATLPNERRVGQGGGNQHSSATQPNERRGGQWSGNQHSSGAQPNERVIRVPSDKNQHFVPPSSLDRGNGSNSSGPVQGYLNGPGPVAMFPQTAQIPDFIAPSSGVWINGMSCQPPQNMGFPNGPSPNNMLHLRQNHTQLPYQMPLPNGMLLQQQFGAGQMLPTNFVIPGWRPGFGAGHAFMPLNPTVIGQNNFSLQAAMGHNNFSQYQAFVGMQGQPAIGQNNFNQPQTVIGMQRQPAIGQNNFSQLQAATGMQGHPVISQNNFSQLQATTGMQGQPAVCGQNNFSQSQAATAMQGQPAVGENKSSQSHADIGMQSQHSPASMSSGEQGVSSSGFQVDQNPGFRPLSASLGNTGDSQNFSKGNVSRGRKSYGRGGTQFRGGRRKQQPR